MTPHPSATAGKQLLLASLLNAIDALSAEIERIEAQMADLLADTQGAVLTEVRGIGVVAASGNGVHRPHRPVAAMVPGLAGWRTGPGTQPIGTPRQRLRHQSRRRRLGTTSHPRPHRQRPPTTRPSS